MFGSPPPPKAQLSTLKLIFVHPLTAGLLHQLSALLWYRLALGLPFFAVLWRNPGLEKTLGGEGVGLAAEAVGSGAGEGGALPPSPWPGPGPGQRSVREKHGFFVLHSHSPPKVCEQFMGFVASSF